MRDATALNAAANHPAVLAQVAPGYESINMTRVLVDPRTRIVGDERGLILLCYRGEDQYEWHWLCTPEVRGADALKLARFALRKAFTEMKACAIFGQTPRVNHAARLMNRALGARPFGISHDSHGRECINYILERGAWVISLKLSEQ